MKVGDVIGIDGGEPVHFPVGPATFIECTLLMLRADGVRFDAQRRVWIKHHLEERALLTAELNQLRTFISQPRQHGRG